MESNFTEKEKKRWLLKKHLKDHAFEYILDIILTMLYAYVLLKICRAEDVVLGLIVSCAWALGRVVWQIHCYKKDYVDLKEE